MFEHREIRSPYPGLRPFEQHEATIFFGREHHVERLLEILRRERFLAVIGPSGSGKSSLVKAGMLPALLAGWTGSGGEWRIASMRPGDRPIRQLARALLEPSALGPELAPDGASSEADFAAAPIAAELRRGPLGLFQLVEDARRRAASGRPLDLLVLVDQFEEIFRYSDAGATQADESDAFVDLLLESRAVAESRIHVVLAMRTDFLGHCVRFLELPEAINRGQYLTPRLSRAQLAAAIARPAEVFGGSVEAELVNDLINAVAGDPDQLPILQHALARMWEAAIATDPRAPHVTREQLAATGGIQGALSRHADSVLASLDDGQRLLAERLFRAITEGGEGASSGTRRPQTLDRIAQATGVEWTRLVPVVNAFAREGVNFLTFVAPLGADSKIDIAHEALIRQWQCLRSWVADEVERAREYRRWRDRAVDWAGGGELLAGADLARAREWLAGPTPDPRPTPEWAARYALRDPADARAEFERTVELIARSEAHEAQRRQAAERAAAEASERERRRLEAEARAAEVVAKAERKAARLARMGRDLKKVIGVIAEIPDEAKRRALAKKYLPGTVKSLSSRQQKQLEKLVAAPTRGARARVPKERGLSLWENGARLRVRFLGGTKSVHEAVKKRALEWTRYANIHFEFVTDPDAKAEVRVSFDPAGGSWSYVGTDALAVPDKEPTMNLGWVDFNVVHEFGHVLGLIHETNNPNANLPWNKPAVHRDLGGPPNHWSKEQVDQVIFAKHAGIEYREFDVGSIMSYDYPASWFLDGRARKGGTTLSASDKRFVRSLYPAERSGGARRKASRKAR